MDGKVLEYHSMYIMSGGTATSTTVNYWGYLGVSYGGTANATTVNKYGELYVSSGGTATATTVNASGFKYVSSGGTANDTTVNSGGDLYVSSGGTATDIVWTPCVGNVYVEDGAYVTYASQYSGVYFGSNNQLLSNTDVMDGK